MIHTSDERAAKGIGTRAQRRELMNGFVVERAMELLEDGGLEALTLARVAESLGYTTTAVYRYFPSKDGLVAAMQRQAIHVIHHHFIAESQARRRLLDGAAAPTQALASLMSAADIYLDLPATQTRAWLLVAVLLGDPRPLLSDEESSRALPVLAAFLSAVDALFEAAVQAGGLDRGDARERTLALWAALHGAVSLEKMRRIAPQSPSSRTIARNIVRALLLSWGASSARLSAAERLASKGK